MVTDATNTLVTYKKCSICGVLKPLTDFHRHKDRPDGRRANCSACARAHTARWAKANPGKIKAKPRTDARRAKEKRADARNREKRALAARLRYHANPAQFIEYANRRRAVINGAGPSFTRQEWLDLQALYNGKCVACGATCQLEPDHIIPVSLGGSCGIDNIQPLCRTCNRTKGNRHCTDYRKNASR